MIEELNLTKDEERILKLLVVRKAGAPSAKFLNLSIKGWFPAAVSALIVLAMFAYLRDPDWLYRFVGRALPWLALLLLSVALLVRDRLIWVRDNLICKLYFALVDKSQQH